EDRVEFPAGAPNAPDTVRPALRVPHLLPRDELEHRLSEFPPRFLQSREERADLGRVEADQHPEPLHGEILGSHDPLTGHACDAACDDLDIGAAKISDRGVEVLEL